MATSTSRPPVGSSGELTAFKSVVERRLGLALRPEDDGRHFAVLTELASARGLSPAQLLDGLTPQDVGRLADRLTINETFFFRNSEHFTALRERVLPELLRASREGHRALRVLSAGCASGEEAYSLAIALEGVGALPHEYVVVGVDISPTTLDRAQRAQYSAWSLRATPDDVRSRYFSRNGDHWALARRVVDRVQFQLGNLADPLGAFGSGEPYDLILCRNVLMYFSPEAMNRALTRLEASLRTGGYLFLGHAESLRARPPTSGAQGHRASTILQVVNAQEAFYYTKVPLPRDEAHAASASGQAPEPHDLAHGAPGDTPDPAWFEHIGRQGERIASLHAEAVRRSTPPPQAAPERLATEVLATGHHADQAARAPFAEGLAKPGCPRVEIAMAVKELEASHFDEVERLCAAHIEDPDAHYLLALCREHLDDPEGAIAHYQMASSLDPTFAMAQVHLGIVHLRLGDPEAARRAFDEAVALLPHESEDRVLWFGGGFLREGLRDHCQRMARAVEVKLGS